MNDRPSGKYRDGWDYDFSKQTAQGRNAVYGLFYTNLADPTYFETGPPGLNVHITFGST